MRKGTNHLKEVRKFADGETVKLVHHCVWPNYSGTVVGFSEGLHRVRIESKPSGIKCGPFDVEATGEELEATL